METEALTNYKAGMHMLLGHINALDLYLQIAQGECQNWRHKKGVTIQVPGLHPEEAIMYDELFGVVQIDASEADSLINFVMLTVCRNAIISLIALVEAYLQDMCEWIFETKPEVFKSNNELKLTHKEIIELGSYQVILDRILADIISDVMRDNVACALQTLYEKKCRWDVSHLEEGFKMLKDASAVRNVVVHNQSRVNEAFLRYISKPETYQLGNEVVVIPQVFKVIAYNSHKLIVELDKIAWQKCKT